MQKDGTPSRVHTLTDATTGEKLYSYEAVKTGAGHGQYSGEVEITTTETDAGFELTDGERGGHKTYDLDQGSSGTGALVTDDDDTWGDGEGDKKPLTSLDVAGHEMTHGLTSATADLNYSVESGGLNEATSDILGTSVEFFADNAGARVATETAATDLFGADSEELKAVSATWAAVNVK